MMIVDLDLPVIDQGLEILVPFDSNSINIAWISMKLGGNLAYSSCTLIRAIERLSSHYLDTSCIYTVLYSRLVSQAS